MRTSVALPLSALPLLVAACARESDSPPCAAPGVRAQGAAEIAATPCGGNTGAILASYHGVPFYSNGSCTGTWSGSYQCPEVVKRYSRHLDWHGNANTYCDARRLRERNLIFLPNHPDSPGQDGDIVAFDGPSCGAGVGHVGLRCGTPDWAHWQLCDQNRTSDAWEDPLPLSREGGQLDTFEASCPLCGYSRPGWDFGLPQGLGTGSYGWTLESMALVSSDDSGIRLRAGNSGARLLSPRGLALNPDPDSGGYGSLHVLMRSSPAPRALRLQFITDRDRRWDERKAQWAGIPRSPVWSEVVIDLGNNEAWLQGGSIEQIRIAAAPIPHHERAADEMTIAWMRFDR